MRNLAIGMIVAGGLALSATAAQAAKLELVDTGTGAVVVDMPVPGFDGVDVAPIETFLGLGAGNFGDVDVTKFEADDGSHTGGTDGLALSDFSASDLAKDNVTIRFTYFGSEASFENVAVATSGGLIELFNNKTSVAGDNVAVDFKLSDFGVDSNDDSFLIPFVIKTLGNGFPSQFGEYDNAAGFSGANDDLELGFSQIVANLFGIDDGSTVAFFGDGTGDTDLDDLVIGISVVPLPAPLVLLGTALLGLGLVSRLRK